MSKSRPDWVLLERFLAGECSPAESVRVRQWLDADPEAAASLDALRRAIDRQALPEPAQPRWDVAQAWARLDRETRGDADDQDRMSLLRRIDGIAASAEDLPPAPPPVRGPLDLGRALRPVSPRWWRVAAALALLTGGGVWLSQWTGAPAARLASRPARVVTTQRAERADLRLPDGTHVVLAPESRLTIPAEFGRTSREVGLAGEGYFDVVHDAAKPFLIRAAHGLVHDLGTRFSVRAYPGDSTVRVVVAGGRVAVGLAGERLPLRGPVLSRGDLARIDRAGAVTIVRGVDLDRYQGWIDGRLRFDATPLRDVLPDVARWYDLDLDLADTAAGDRRLTLTLRDESLAQALSAIAYLSHTRYETNGRVVRFFAVPGTGTSSVSRTP